jgi:modification methylase
VLKKTGTLWVIGTYHNIYRVGTILQDLEYWILNDFVWVKTNPMPNFRGVRFTNAQETLIWAQKNQGARYTFNHHVMKALNGDLQMRSDWYLPICTGRERIKINGNKAHSAQKPEALLYRIVMSSSNPGDVVLDPFFGTGTTGAVARKLGRKWIGIELNEAYVDVARARIQAIKDVDISEDAIVLQSNRKQPRVPFGTLIEHGLLQPGQKLYFDGRDEITATIMANGHIRFQDNISSIHKVAKQILEAPCNGWKRWFYEEDTGKRFEIDRLRDLVRAEWNRTHSEE